jgi:hypothetical protein
MAGYSHLAGFEPIDRILAPGTAPELEAKGAVPLFWLAFFDDSCLREEPLTGCQYAAKQGELFAVGAPYLVSDSTSAMARWRKRQAALQKKVGEEHKKLLRDFGAFARRLKPSMIVRLEDLNGSELGSGAELVAKVRGALKMIGVLDNPEMDPAALLEGPLEELWLKGPAAAGTDEAATYSGWGWQVTSEERAKRARERKWQKAVGEKPDAELLPYTPTRTFAPDELVAHQTLGSGVVLRIVDASKIEVLFRDGPRTLVHGRK